MGNLVPFEKRKKDREVDKPAPPASAEILIFTGIRYQRGTPETPDKTSPPRRAKRKRG